MGLQYKSFENTVGRGEIVCNKQFLLFPQCFLLIWRLFLQFSSNLKLSSANSFGLEEFKICCLGSSHLLLFAHNHFFQAIDNNERSRHESWHNDHQSILRKNIGRAGGSNQQPSVLKQNGIIWGWKGWGWVTGCRKRPCLGVFSLCFITN